MPPQPEAPLLEIAHLSKVFMTRQGLSARKFSAVDDASITLTAEKPEVYAVAGESGSGKTTLARIVLGLETPTSGRLAYKGREVSQLSAGERRKWFYIRSAAGVPGPVCYLQSAETYRQLPV